MHKLWYKFPNKEPFSVTSSCVAHLADKNYFGLTFDGSSEYDGEDMYDLEYVESRISNEYNGRMGIGRYKKDLLSCDFKDTFKVNEDREIYYRFFPSTPSAEIIFYVSFLRLPEESMDTISTIYHKEWDRVKDLTSTERLVVLHFYYSIASFHATFEPAQRHRGVVRWIDEYLANLSNSGVLWGREDYDSPHSISVRDYPLNSVFNWKIEGLIEHARGEP